VDWAKTGIAGLDNLLSGGFARGSSALLIGPVGTLKSYMGLQFIYEGLRDHERCTYISAIYDFDTICDQAKSNFGWDIKPYRQKGLLNFVNLRPLFESGKFLDVGTLIGEIEKPGTGKPGARALICSLSPMFNFVEDERAVLRTVFALNEGLRKMGVTILYVTDQGAQPKLIEENLKSICDYVLTTEMRGKERRIRILKALTKHGLEWHKLSLTDKGIEVELVL
jgi:circadian clock protein KaiC